MILSIITSGKNDNYGNNFLQRLQFNLEKLNDNIQKLSVDDVEVILVDWASDDKISNSLSPSRQKYTNFLYVNNRIANEISPDCSFSHVHSLNSGFRKSKGDFVFFIDGDSYIPFESFSKLYETCKKHKLNNLPVFYWASRYHLPYELHSNSNTIEEIDNHIIRWTENNKVDWRHDKINLEKVQAPMGLLLSRAIVEDSTGYYEKLNKWGYIETEYSRRLNTKNTCNGDLEDDNTVFFHLDHHSVAKLGKDKKTNDHENSSRYNANGENWGLINKELEYYKTY